MSSLVELGRLLFFADLRPDHVEVIYRDPATGEERTEVACAIVEQPGVEHKIREDFLRPWVKRRRLRRLAFWKDQDVVTADLADLLSSERPDVWGEGVETVSYLVLQLDASGDVIDDLWFDDLEAAKEFLDPSSGVEWELLPAEPELAAEAIRRRLGTTSDR